MAGIKRLAGETDSEYWGRVNKIIDERPSPETKSMIDDISGIISSYYDLMSSRVFQLKESIQIIIQNILKAAK